MSIQQDLQNKNTSQPWTSLRNRNFRRYLFGQGVSNTGTWLQQTAELWLILEMTGSGTALGLHTVFRQGPVLLFGVLGGLISDRNNHLRLLMITQMSVAAVAATFAAVAWTSTPSLLAIYILVGAQGLINAVDNPLRRAFIRDLTTDAELSNAVSLYSSVITISRTIGPALGGILIASAGVKWSFTANALSYVVVIGSLILIDRESLRQTAPIGRARGQLREGLSYAWTRRKIRNTLILVSIVSVFAWHWQVLLSAYTSDVFDGEATLYGVMISILSLGALIGALTTARIKRIGGRHLVLSSLIVSLALGIVAVAPSLLIAFLGLALLGAAGTSFTVGSQARLQLNVTDQMSGRVMALFSVAFLGSRPLGGLLGGWFIDVSGPRAAFAVGAVVIPITLMLGWMVSRRRRVDFATK